MKRLTAALAALSIASPLLAAGEADVQRCRALASDAARLACYDALFGRGGTPGSPAAGAAPSAGPAAAGPAAAPAAAAAAAAAPTGTASTTGAAPATAAGPAPTAAAAFGLPAAESPDELRSHIPGRFDGWEPNSRITLANGQVWQITDGSRGVYRLDSPKVRIRKGVLGSFFLEIEGQNQSPRVRRVQ